MYAMTLLNPAGRRRVLPRTLDPLFTDFFRPFLGNGDETRTIKQTYPRTDVYETTDEYVVSMDAPGIQKGDIGIKYEAGRLAITGRRQFIEQEGVRYHLKESLTGAFARSFNLPDDVEGERITAEVRDGVLTIHIPKRDEAKPRHVDIKVA